MKRYFLNRFALALMLACLAAGVVVAQEHAKEPAQRNLRPQPNKLSSLRSIQILQPVRNW